MRARFRSKNIKNKFVFQLFKKPHKTCLTKALYCGVAVLVAGFVFAGFGFNGTVLTGVGFTGAGVLPGVTAAGVAVVGVVTAGVATVGVVAAVSPVGICPLFKIWTALSLLISNSIACFFGGIGALGAVIGFPLTVN